MRSLVVLLVGCGFHGSQNNGGMPPPIDAAEDPFQDAAGTGVDAAPAMQCYANGVWKVCLGSKPTNAVVLSGMLDTEHDTRCLGAQPTGWYPAQPSSCFVVGSTIAVPLGQTLRVFGKKPLVLVADLTITVAGTIDAGSHRAGSPGPSWGSTDCPAWVADPKNGTHGGGGGGAGGTFMTKGGDGGDGDNGKGSGGASMTGGVAPTKLRGGCNGQLGYAMHHFPFGPPSGASAGGGAVYLVAGNMIDVSGSINVSGGGGAANNRGDGGDGAGSGGMIVLIAQTVSAVTLVANGGGGASGGTSQLNGSDGDDGSDPMVAAAGGQIGANGGSGYGGGMAATNGASGGTGDGGAGGGGGAGYIQSSFALPDIATISPRATFVAN